MKSERAAAVEPRAPKPVTPAASHRTRRDAAAKGERTGPPAVARRPSVVPARANHLGAGPIPAPRTARVTAPAIPVPASLRTRLAPVVGTRAVEAARLHTDPAASARAREHNARALAEGEDVYFGEGQYRPGTSDGDALIAHEIAHVDQAQRGLLKGPARKALSAAVQSPLETAADEAADHLAAGADLDEQQKARRGRGKKPYLTLVPQEGTGETQATEAPAEPAAALQGPTPAPGEEAGGAPADAAATSAETAPAPAAPVAAVPPELPLMPEPSVTLSKAEESRAGGVQARATGTARAVATAPAPSQNVSVAKAAVLVPQAENDARAAEKVVAELATKEKPSPEIVALCDRIKTLIAKKRPADEEGVIDTRPQEVAQAAGSAVEGGVQKNVDDAKSSYGSIDGKPTGPQSAAPPEIEPLPAAVAAPEVNAAAATPDAVPPEQVNLDGDSKQMDARAQEAGLEGEPAQLVKGGPVGEARDARGEIKDLSKDGPAEALKQQQAALAQSDADMAALQARALASLKEARAGHAGGVKTQQGEFKGGEEAQRAELSKQAENVFTAAQTRVQDILRDVPTTAMKKWSIGLPSISTQFNDDLKVVKDKIDDRHSGVSGWFVAGWDSKFGLPGWVTKAYDAAEKKFGDSVCALITDISIYVNTTIKIADDIIAEARTDISDIFTKNLPEGLKTWAAEQEKSFGKKLDGLHQQAEETRTSFNKELIENAGGAVQSARESIQKLRQEAKGLWGRFLDAVGRFLDDPVKFIINGLLALLQISPAAFWAVVAKIQKFAADIADAPLRFASNLMAGISRGFSLFFDNFARHLIEGFLEWLLSGMADEGIAIEIPKELSLKSVVGFFLQLLGISWTRIRKLLVEQLGEKAVALIEKTGGAIATLATKGIAGIYEDIKKMLEPQTIIDAIIDAAIKYLSEALIVKVTARIIAMLNPVGAILAALEAIYRVLKWIFTNAAKIFHLVEAVVNGIGDILAGNIAGVGKMVEDALARLIAPVIDFLADYIGLGGLPGKVANAVKSLQGWVEGVLRNVITWLVDLGKKMLAAMGFEQKEGAKDTKGADGAIGETLVFAEGNETHRLYIDVTGKGATVMVASTPMTLTGWLDDLEHSKVPALPDKETQHSAFTLITTARKQLGATDADADKTVEAKSNTEGAAAPPDLASKIKAEEEALRDTLQKLGAMFGHPVIVKSLKIPGPAKVDNYSDALLTSIESTQTGVDLHTGSTGPDFVKNLLERRQGTASFDEGSGALSLPGASPAALAAATSATEMGDQAAATTGVARVGFKKGQANFTLIGAIDEVNASLATGDAPPFRPIEKMAQMATGQETVRIVDSEGHAALVEQGGAGILDTLNKAYSGPFAGARNKTGRTLVSETQKQLLGPDKKLHEIALKGWLATDARKQFDETVALTVSAVEKVGGELDIQDLKRAVNVEKTPTTDTVIFNMSVPGSVGSNTTYRNNFEAEVERQLSLQREALNAMTIDAWFANIDTYKATQEKWVEKLTPAARAAVLTEVLRRIDDTVQQAIRASGELLAAEGKAKKIKDKLLKDSNYTVDQALDEITSSDYVRNRFVGRFGNEDKFREEHFDAIMEVLQKLYPDLQGLESSSGLIKDAVLHNPDQIAGGFGMLPDLQKVKEPGPGEDTKAWDAYLAVIESYIGASRVNSRIGPGWADQIETVYQQIKTRHKKEGSYPLWLLNFSLSANYKA